MAALVLVGGAAHADGVLSLRGAYYKESATRVAQPMLDATFEAGAHGRVDAHLLVDSITSASAATGAMGNEFTEQRYEIGAGYTHTFGDFRLGGQARYSVESDYFSGYFAISGELALAEQNTTIRLILGRGSDKITNGVAVSLGSLGTPRQEEHLDTTLVSTTFTQLISPRVLVRGTYDFMYLDGYQGNVYRVVRGASQPVQERVPDVRHRHAFAVGGRVFLPTGTTLSADYRFYIDNWGIIGHTPELRVTQSVLDASLDLRVRYRFHTQSAADFYKDVYTAAEIMDPNVPVTADVKLGGFDTHTLGGQVSVAMAAFGARGTFGATRLELSIDHIWQDTAFGNAFVAQAGVTVPFDY